MNPAPWRPARNRVDPCRIVLDRVARDRCCVSCQIVSGIASKSYRVVLAVAWGGCPAVACRVDVHRPPCRGGRVGTHLART